MFGLCEPSTRSSNSPRCAYAAASNQEWGTHGQQATSGQQLALFQATKLRTSLPAAGRANAGALATWKSEVQPPLPQVWLECQRCAAWGGEAPLSFSGWIKAICWPDPPTGWSGLWGGKKQCCTGNGSTGQFCPLCYLQAPCLLLPLARIPGQWQ